jgi:environmental stress-induced protein Ves
MIIKCIKNTQHKTIKWVGGTTTQLAIYPETSSYPDRNFLFRISTAKIETEESEFTKLPGVSRKLMILDGEIKIEHKGRYTKNLKKFDQDSFEGNWDTKSYGKAVDFNLMTTGNTKGDIEVFIMDKNKEIRHTINSDIYCIYIYSGKVNVSCSNKIYELFCGDILLAIAENEEQNLVLLTIEKSEVVFSKINIKNLN